MKSNSVFMILVILLASVTVLSVNVRKVGASGMIYIRADGRVDPSTAPITTVDNVTYVLTDDINDSVVVERNSIVLDGAGHTVTGTGSGIGTSLTGGNNVTVRNMTINNFYNGIDLEDSPGNALSDDNVTNNKHGIYLYNSSDNILSDNRGANNTYGIDVEDSSGNALSGNIVTNNGVGFQLYSASFTTLSGNNVANNNSQGIFVSFSSNNTMSGNNAANNDCGINLESASYNTVSGNNVANNWLGIGLDESGGNTLSGNNVTASSGYGIELMGLSFFNTLVGNNVANNGLGLHIDWSSVNRIFHNSFVDNAQQVLTAGSNNTWDDGYPSGGNYWSDYSGKDLFSGPHQNETGPDWIGDSPYVIDQNNTDRYPLMYPYSSEVSEIEVAYRGLLMKFNQMQLDLKSLNSSLITELNNSQQQIDILNSTTTDLKAKIENLTLELNQMNSTLLSRRDSMNNTIVTLQSQLTSLNSTLQNSTSTTQDHYNSLSNQLDTISKAIYLLTAITAILIATTAYLAIRRPKTKHD